MFVSGRVEVLLRFLGLVWKRCRSCAVVVGSVEVVCVWCKGVNVVLCGGSIEVVSRKCQACVKSLCRSFVGNVLRRSGDMCGKWTMGERCVK